MTLPASGAISLSQIAAEFGLASNAAFPTAFYGKGGAPASGALGFSDFYGRSGGFSVSANSPVSGFGSGSTINTSPSTASVVGGTPPYTYAWTFEGGDALTALSPSSASTAFQSTTAQIGEPQSATFNCSVTDSLGAIGTSNSVLANITRS